jgi:adsorption protein B
MSESLILFTFVIAVLICLSSIDDLLIDFLTLCIVRHRLAARSRASSATTASFVANWHVQDVLESMVEGNLARIQDRNIKIVLGVYPNDTETREVAEQLVSRHPERVRAS